MLQIQYVMASLPTTEFVLAGHAMHEDPAVSFAFRNVPALQSEHSEEPLVALNVPGAQAWQSEPSYPALHIHSHAPATEVEVLAHSLHFCAALAF